MAGQRSPRYPGIDLQEAVEKVARIFEAEHDSPMSGEVAVGHLGYGSLNGASLMMLSALRKYGLLEGRAEQTRVSKDAITIIADAEVSDQTERQEALRRALVTNSIFAKLYSRFGPTASEPNIKSYLLKSGFKPDAAMTAARSYLDSVAFVQQEADDYTPVEDWTSEDEEQAVPSPSPAQPSRQATQPPPQGMQDVQIPLPGVPWPSLRAQVPMSAETWKQMMSMLDAMKPALVDDASDTVDGDGQD